MSDATEDDHLSHVLEARLRAVLADAVGDDLQPDERQYIEALPPAEFASLSDLECRWLVIRWAGSEMRFEWDSTDADALDQLTSSAETIVENLVGDHWYEGGWRSHAGVDGIYTAE